MDHSKNRLKVEKKGGNKMVKKLVLVLIVMFMAIPFALNAESMIGFIIILKAQE